MKKSKILALILALAMVLSAFSPVSADSSPVKTDPTAFTGKMCTSDSNAAAAIDFIKGKYADMSTYPGSGECWGYAEKANSILASANSTKFYKGLSFNEKNFRNKCLNAKAGTHIRLHRQPEFDAWHGHSVVLYKVTDELVCWGDNNYIGSNTVGYYSGTLQEFMMYYGQYGYLNMVKQPTKYRSYSAPQVSSALDPATGGIKVTWLKTTGTSRYDVYRSYSKNGKYTRIAKTTSKNYTDKGGTVGKKAYYKVKSVKSAGSKYSNIVGRTRKLARPVVTAGNDKDGNIQLTWKSVAKADKYYVYRFDWDTYTFKKVKTVTGCSYTDKVTNYGAAYKVKAIYTKNTLGNSPYSEEITAYRESPAPESPIISGMMSGGSAYLRWDDVDGAEYYLIYRADSADGEYEYYDEVYDNYYEDSDREPGEHWYYKVKAFSYEGSGSGFSNVVSL